MTNDTGVAGNIWLGTILLSLALSFPGLALGQADLLPDEPDEKPLSELTEADLLPDEDPVLTGVFVWTPREVIDSALSKVACEMEGKPCEPVALHAVRTMVLPKLRFNDEIPTTETLEFPYEDNGRHKTFENEWGEERLAPGDDFIYPMLEAFDALSASRGGDLYSGTVETECGPVQWSWGGIVSNYAEDDVAMTSYLTLTGNCNCKLVNGKPLSIFYYSAEVTQDLRFGQNILRDQAWDAVPEDDSRYNSQCSLNAACCPVEEELGDAFPPGGGDEFVLEWDSPEWCTYGGGGVTIGGGGVTIGPGGTTTTPPPVPPGEGGGNGGGTPPVPPGEGGGNNGGGLPPVPPAEGGNGGEDNGGGLPPVPPADNNGGDDDDNGGHDGENGGDDGDPPVPPVINLTIKATSATLVQGANVAGAGMLVQINTGDPAQVPGDTGAIPDDSGSADGELSGTTDANGELQLEVPAAVVAALGGTLLNIDTTPYSGLVMTFAGEVDAASVLPGELMPYVQQAVMFGGNTYIPLLIPEAMVAGLQGLIDSANTLGVEINICIDPKPLSDPYFGSSGSWEQPYPDQWAIQRVGFTDDRKSAWEQVKPKGEPVIVALVDSGLDWNHREIDWDSLWRNPDEVPGNGIDDDGNGYIDDTIGWDFWDNDRKPWDNDGHGTFVAGVMFANPDNGEGITGVARHAKLMVLKAMNAFGHTRATSVAQAIKYAADNGARVINLSLGGPESSTVVREAIDYAHARNAVVVVAAGNEAVPAENQSVAGLPNALTVAATGFDDKRSVYSNYGAGIDLAAPGDDILSLRARRTDLLKNIPGVDYETESAFVGEDRRYYRASGTSFATPIVSGAAALVIANKPDLSADEVMRVLKQSARDVETTGVDHFTGYGIVDARAALKADPDFYLDAAISGVTVAERDGAQALLVNGSMGADRFRRATITIGKGEEPDKWEKIETLKKPTNGELTAIPATRFAGAKVWIIRLQVEHRNGQTREFRFRLALG